MKKIILLLALAFQIASPANQPLSPFTQEQRVQITTDARQWAQTCVQTVCPADLQLIANFLYLSYASSVLQVSLKNSASHLFGIMWQLNNTCYANENPGDECGILHSALAQLDRLARANAYLANVWQSSQECIDKIEKEEHAEKLTSSLYSLKNYAEKIVSGYAQDNHDRFTTNIYQSHQSLSENQHELTEIMQALAHVTPAKESTSDHVELVTASVVIANSINDVSHNLYHITRDLTQDFFAVQYVGQIVFTLFYTQLYQEMKNAQIPAQYFSVMFDETGIYEPQETSEQIPDPAKNVLVVNGARIALTPIYTENEINQII